jgi:hypothetical protein
MEPKPGAERMVLDLDGHQFEGVDEQPLLPWQQMKVERLLGEFDDRETR